MHTDWHGAHLNELLYRLKPANFLFQIIQKSGRIWVVYAPYYLRHSYIIYLHQLYLQG